VLILLRIARVSSKCMSTHMLTLDVAIVAGEAQARQPLLKIHACDNPFSIHTLHHTITLL